MVTRTKVKKIKSEVRGSRAGKSLGNVMGIEVTFEF